MSFNIYDIENYNIDENYKQSFINIKKNCDYIDSFKNIIETYNEEILKKYVHILKTIQMSFI